MLLSTLSLLSYHCSSAGAGPAGKTKGGPFQWISSLVQLAAQILAIIQEMMQEEVEKGNEVTFPVAAWIVSRLKCPGDDSLICSHFLMDAVGNAKINQDS